jgi:hypothetical protein
MKEINHIDVKMTFNVSLFNIKVPDDVYEQLMELGENSITIDHNDDEFPDAKDWLDNNISSDDAYMWEYEVEEFVLGEKEDIGEH